MLLQGEGVVIKALAGARQRGAQRGASFLQPAATPLQDAQASVGFGLGEESHMDVESFVFPGFRAGLVQQLLEVFLAFSGEGVHDSGATAGEGGGPGVGRTRFGDPTCGEHRFQRGVQRAV